MRMQPQDTTRRIGRTLGAWAVPAALAVPAVVFTMFGESATDALEWRRDVLAVEPWRVVTGHLVHLDPAHLALNVAGLAVLWLLVGPVWRTHIWAATCLGVMAAVSIGLLWVPALDWYVGLSGLLHGMLAAGAVGLWRDWRTGSAILLAFLALKAGWEVAFGAATGVDAVVEAHWIGSAAGGLAGIMSAFARRGTAR